MKKLYYAYLFFVLAVVYITLSSHSTGMATNYNDDRTGAPSAGLCSAVGCHSGGSFGTTVSIQIFTAGTTNAVSAYVGGTTYDMRVAVNHSSGTPAGYGFEFTCLTTPGNVAVATTYTNLASNVKQKLITTGTFTGRRYTEHNGTSANNIFNFSWTAPAQGTGTVKFYASGNCVNGNSMSSGDLPNNTSLTLSEFIPLSVSGTTTDISCFGESSGSINITASGGTSPYTYNWGGGITNEDRNNIAIGTYTVTVTDNTGSTATASFTISQPAAALSVNGAVTNVSCNSGNNGAINITASGGTAPYLFNWGGGITSEDRNSIVSGNYSVTVTDNNSCTISASFTVSQPVSALSVSGAKTDVSCFGGNTGTINITASGGTPNYTYNWGSGITSEDRNSLTAGNYTITVTDANSCTFSAAFIITQPASALNISGSTANVSCFGGSNGAINITPSGGTPNYSYNWGSGVTSEDRFALPAGNYSVTATDNNSCTTSVSFSVSQPVAVLSVTGTITQILCNGANTGAINITAAGGTSPYFFNWGSGITVEDRTAITAGNYSVTVTDANSCNSSASFTINQPVAITIAETHVNVLCNGATGSIDITVTNAVSPYAFLWNDTATAEDRSNLSPGNYSVTITDNNSCTASNDIVVGSNSGMVFGTSQITDVTCNGGHDGSIITSLSGGAPPYSPIWNDGNTSFTRTNLSAGSYTLSVTDNNSCVQVLNVTIAEPPVLSIAETHTDVLCFGNSTGSINIFPSGGTPPYSYLWGDLNVSQNRNGLATGNYSVTITDNKSCADSRNIFINQPTQISLSESHTNVLCYHGCNGSATLSASGGIPPYSYAFFNGNFSPNPNFTNLCLGDYTLFVNDSNSCSASLIVSIAEPDSIAVSVVSVTPNNGSSNGAIDISVSGGVSPYSFHWSNGATTEDISGLAEGTYSVTVLDNNNCSAGQFGAAIINTSLNDVSSGKINLYPNPFTNELLIDLDAGINPTFSIKIISLQGTLIKTFETSSAHSAIDVSDIPPSIYFVQISSGNLLRRIKMLKTE